MKATILFLIIYLFCNVSFSQDVQWSFYQNIDGIDVFTSKQITKDPTRSFSKEIIFLKFKNTTFADAKIILKKEFYYKGVCANCNSSVKEHFLEINLIASESTSGNLREIKPEHQVFSKFIGLDGARELSKVELIKTSK